MATQRLHGSELVDRVHSTPKGTISEIIRVAVKETRETRQFLGAAPCEPGGFPSKPSSLMPSWGQKCLQGFTTGLAESHLQVYNALLTDLDLTDCNEL